MVSHNNDRKYYRIAFDTAKEGDEIFNLTEYFKARVGDRNYGLQMTWYEQGSLKNVKGLKPYIHGNVGHYSIGDDGEIIMAPDASVVSYVGAPSDTDVAGRAVYHFPEQMFPQEGIFYGFIGLIDDSDGDQRLSGVNIWFKVLAGVAYMGKASAYYIGEMDKLIHNSEERIRQLLDQGQKDVDAKQAALQAIVDDYKTKMSDLIERLNAQGQTANSMMETVKAGLSALETKIQQDGLFTQAEADQFKKSVLSVTVNSFENVDAMSKSSDLTEGVTAKTQGYYAKGDGGAATYRIVSAPTDFTVKLDNGLYADPVKESVVTPNMFGARDNVKYQPSIDSTDAFRKALAFSDRVSVPEGSYKVQGLNIPAKKVLAGAGQFATILYGYGDDIIKFTDSSYNNVLSDLQINANAGFAAVHCKYAPASGDPFDSHNRIENVRTSGGKYGFFVEYPSRGVMIVNGYASGVSDTLYYIQGTDNNLVSCGGQDAPIGYELQNNNTMTSCGCFAISDRAVILRGSWCQVTSFIGQDCQSGFYIPSQSNVVTGKLDRMGYYTPGSKSYDVMLTETSRNNSISLSVTEGRQPSNGDKENGKSYVETILNVSNAIASQNIINITANILNDVTPTLCNRANEDLFVRNNDVYINGKLLSDLRYSGLSRKETVDVTVADGGTFTPSVAGQLIITTNHTEDAVWAVCAVKTQAYINGYQQYLYAKHGFGRLGETVQVPVSAGEAVVFQQNNSAVMTMSAKFVPYK